MHNFLLNVLGYNPYYMCGAWQSGSPPFNGNVGLGQVIPNASWTDVVFESGIADPLGLRYTVNDNDALYKKAIAIPKWARRFKVNALFTFDESSLVTIDGYRACRFVVMTEDGTQAQPPVSAIFVPPVVPVAAEAVATSVVYSIPWITVDPTVSSYLKLQAYQVNTGGSSIRLIPQNDLTRWTIEFVAKANVAA